jgi:hypothetical protein
MPTCPKSSNLKYFQLLGSEVEGTITIPLQAWTGTEDTRRLRLSDFKTLAHEGGNVVNPMHRLPLPPGSIPGTHFC